MSERPDDPVVLTTVPTEGEAAILIAALDDTGIKAQMIGGLTSGLRAEAPGEVSILVHRGDFEQARLVLASLRPKPSAED